MYARKSCDASRSGCSFTSASSFIATTRSNSCTASFTCPLPWYALASSCCDASRSGCSFASTSSIATTCFSSSTASHLSIYKQISACPERQLTPFITYFSSGFRHFERMGKILPLRLAILPFICRKHVREARQYHPLCFIRSILAFTPYPRCRMDQAVHIKYLFIFPPAQETISKECTNC